MGRKAKLAPEKTCLQCGVKMERKRFASGQLEDLTRFKKRKYCDQECMAKAMDGVIKVITPRNSRKQSRKLVKPICEKCGRSRRETRLYVHHIDENPLNNDPSNLITLCGSCHQLTHAQTSKGMPLPVKLCEHCSTPARKQGMCQKHYQRWKKHGDPFLVKLGGNSGGRIVRADS